MTARGVRATLPATTYHRPSPLSPEWVVSALAEDGSSNGQYDFARLPGSNALWGPLAVSFAHRVDVGGPWRRRSTVEGAWDGLSHFLRWLTGAHPAVTTLASLTVAHWREYVLAQPTSVTASRVTRVKALLLESGALQPEVARAVEGRSKRYQAKVQPSLTSEQARLLQREALRTVVTMARRVRQGWTLLNKHRACALDPDSADGQWGALLHHVYEHHDVPRYTKGRAVASEVSGLTGHRRSLAVFTRLYMTAEEAAAACAVLALAEGFNPDIIRNLSVNDISRVDAQDGTEPTVFRVKIDKPRRQALRFGSANLVETSRHTPAHVLRLVLESTAPARAQLAELGVEADALFLHLRGGMQGRGSASLPPLTSTYGQSQPSWSRAWRSWLSSLPGDIPHVTLQGLRRFAVTTGRAQGHTEATNANIYRLNDAGVRAAQKPLIAEGIQHAFDAAQAVVLATPATADNSIDATLAASIDAGDLDTPTATCTNYEHSPFDNDRVCTASFLLCLACRNAVVVPRLLPRLCYLLERLDALRGNVSEDLWRRYYAPHWQRLTHLLDSHFASAERAAARDSLTTTDQDMIDALLRRRFDA
ncbi:hypothetical protein HC028_05765 [Planosporangium flavigriseum]|uniref:Uncharacterized protein n=1 Tax=Planosporangium flavigriseum TaxID=373681 RepID=A0A8J3LK84_9ACTN|nr:hypothetical protein [Planosporangium flavigriseum]NJC64018.1 hypothetical protein [Planosporangium flavigriseum]GIG72899.1 hypothetical protein Pfl04_13030 [Planosporangium flavigriseum]